MMLNPEGIEMGANGTEAAPDPNAALRFEDLTIDDDLSLLERVVRYVRSGIALQRLVHVKMIADTAKSVGTLSTMQRLIPLLPQLIVDAESIIRQHLASQLLPLCLTCMFGDDKDFDPNDKAKLQSRTYNEEGYKIVTNVILNHLNTLLTDQDVDVRKAASDAIATLALYIKPDDVAPMILPIPLRLAHENKTGSGAAVGAAVGGRTASHYINNSANTKQNEKEDGNNDDFHITSTNLLGDMASLDSSQIPPSLVSKYITPTIVSLCKHSSFRVRRAAVQALPRIVNGSSIDDIQLNLIPCFVRLSGDDVFRVRKSVGECLVDMSRSLMLIPSSPLAKVSTLDNIKSNYSQMSNEKVMQLMMQIRRQSLVPICTRLLGDNNKSVRHGMMQFLGPFIASFYPLDGEKGKTDDEHDNGIIHMLGGRGNENKVGGMGVQFFPHANGMVSRLNPSTISAVLAKKDLQTDTTSHSLDSKEHLESLLPKFMEKCHNDAKSLVLILHHKQKHPLSPEDSNIVLEKLLPPYAELAAISTGDDNVDAEMRVYCAYSLPAVVLLLGKEGWDMSLKTCFLTLITGHDGSMKNEDAIPVPLPVKRCLASSFHTICHILGRQALKGSSEEKNAKRDLLSIFENHFLRDSDDTVRLNVIRNLSSLMSLLSDSKRTKYLPVLYEIITGDAMLASKRKSAMNPMILNWRQRDMIAQIIPNLIILYKPSQVRQFIWPIVKILLSDSVNIVRENVEWSIPILLHWYEPKNCNKETKDPVTASKFSSEACHEVFVFLKATLLDNTVSLNQPTPAFGKSRSSGSFSKRQSYCRVLTAVALILRLNDKEKRRQRKKEPKDIVDFPPHAFYNLSSDQYRHVYHVLQELLLPSAIIMKDDKVTNVRLTLAKCLRVMPLEIRDEGEVCTVLSTLEDEIHTWEGGGGQYIDGSVPINPSSPGKRHTKNGTSVKSGAKMSPSKTSRQKSPATSPEIREDDAQAAIERGQLRAEEEESSTMATI